MITSLFSLFVFCLNFETLKMSSTKHLATVVIIILSLRNQWTTVPISIDKR